MNEYSKANNKENADKIKGYGWTIHRAAKYS